MRTALAALLAIAAGVLTSTTAQAHPHVWVTIHSEVVFGPDGAATEVRHHWAFDEMFSTFATQGMDSKKPGGLTREELAPLAEVNVTSLKEFDYFTVGRANGKQFTFNDPRDYWLEQKGNQLVLHFTLPITSPVQAKKLDFAISDTSWFVDFSLSPDNAVALVNAPTTCKASAQGPNAPAASATQPLDESFFEGDAGARYGVQFANRISVACP
jgi:ABC-type uncharacterized transport system substrate-binding protein